MISKFSNYKNLVKTEIIYKLVLTSKSNDTSLNPQKKEDLDSIRNSEKFFVVGLDEAVCKSCGFYYTPEKGDINYPVPRGTRFSDLPDDWSCPTCGVNKAQFESKTKVIAGFSENQKYGFGTNLMTSEQKSILIYGTLLFIFMLFIGGYFLD